MTPRIRQALQEKILDEIKRSHPGTTDAQIAAAAGCDRTMVSKWRSGDREMGLAEIVGLQATFGAAATLAPIANLDHHDVLPRREEPVAVLSGSVRLVETAAAMLGEAHHALADGRISPSERNGLLQRLRILSRTVAGLVAGLEDLR